MKNESIVQALSELRAKNLSDEEYIEELVELWEDAQTSNRDLSTDELTRDRPHLATPLTRKIALLQRFSKRVQATVPGLPPAALAGSRYQTCEDGYVASGGLGDIFRVHDSTLDRDVALKRPQDRWQSQREVLQRLEREARLTAKLEHPGIVPTYEYGTDATGRPYYVMRLIQGTSLRDAIAALHHETAHQAPGDLGSRLRGLVQKIVSVCNALAYAHSRGVIHRDVKPDNVMLGEFGETFLVDWGLAAELDAAKTPTHETNSDVTTEHSGTETRPGREMGTYGFMSPEQANGLWNEVGPASDIFSLGATLYSLLTNQPPYSGANKAEQARSGKYEPPQKKVPSVSPVLAAICCKAMSLRPVDRYQTPLEMAADLERWLADEPISCFRDSRITTLFRWIRRHRVSTAAAIATVLVTLIAFGVGTAVLSIKNEALTAANSREREARTQSETNEKAAKQQSQLALSTLTSVIQEIQGGLKNVPGGSEVRRRLLAKSLEKLKSVSTQFLAQSSVDRSTILALHEMGEVIMTFGTGDVSPAATIQDLSQLTSDSTSAVQLAAIYYQRAFAIANTLAEDDPGNSEKQRDLSSSFERLGEVFLWLGRTSDTLKQFNEALNISRKLANAHPGNAAVRRDLSHSCRRLGDVLLRLGQTKDALTHYREALTISRELSNADSRNDTQQRELAISCSLLGDSLLMVGQTEDALSRLQESAEIFRALVERDPSDAGKQQELSIAYDKLGTVFLKLGQNEAALAQFEEGTKIVRTLVEADPTALKLQRDLSASYQNLGDALYRLGRTESSLAHYEKSLEIHQRLALADSDNAQLQLDMAMLNTKAGDALWMLTRTEDALQRFRDALRISRNVAEFDKNNSQKQRFLSVALQHMGDILRSLGRNDDARLQFEESLAIQLALAESDQSNFERQNDLSNGYERLGDVSLSQGQPDDALRFFNLCYEIAKHQVEIDPTDALSHRNLSISHSKLGDLFLQIRRTDDALTQFQASAAILQSLASAEPNDAQRQRDLWASHYKLAQVRMSRDEFSLAAEEYETAIVILKKMIERQMNPQLATAELSMVEMESRSVPLAKVALGEWDALLRQASADELPLYLEIRGIRWCKSGRFSDAEQAAGKLAELPQATYGQLYNAACVLSLCAASIQVEDGKELTPEASAKRMRLLADAMATLEKSVEKGWPDFAHMQQDSDLALLRELPEFKALIPASDAKSIPDAAE